MSSTRILRCAAALALVLATAGVLYAQAKAPEAAPAAEPKAPEAPAAVPVVVAKPLTDVEILAKVPQGMDAVVIVKSATGLDDKVVEFLGTFMPKEEAPPVEQMKPMANILEELLDNPSAVKPGSPFLFVVKFKESLDQDPQMAVLLDLADFKAFVGETKPDAQGVYEIDSGACVPYQGLIMFGKDADELAALAKIPAGIKLSAPQTALMTGSDVYAHIDLAALMKAAAPIYEKEHARIAERIKELETPQEGADKAEVARRQKWAAERKAELKLMESLWSAGQQLQGAAAGGNVSPKGADVQFTCTLKPGSALAGYLTGHPALGAKLAPALPDVDSSWLALWWSADNKKIGQAAVELFGVLRGAVQLWATEMSPAGLGADDEGDAGGAEVKQFLAAMDKIEQLLKTKGDLLIAPQGAMAAIAGKSDGLMNVVSAQKVADRADYQKRIDAMAELQKLYCNDLIGAMGAGIKADFAVEPGAQKIGDLTVDRQVFKFTLPADQVRQEGPNPQKMLEMFFGGSSFVNWTTFAEGYMIQQQAQQPNQIANVVKALQGGPGLIDNPVYQGVRQYTLKDANLVGTVSAGAYCYLMAGMMMPVFEGNQAPQIPAPPPAAFKAKSVFSLSAAEGALSGRIYVPTTDLQQVVAAMMEIQKAMMQHFQRMQPVDPVAPQRRDGPPIM
jgi:hypothetical protein